MAKRKKRTTKKKASRPAPKPRPRGPRGAGHSRVVGRPQNWDKAVAAAYLRAIGASQEQAAESAGLSPETLGGYEHSPWWPDAQREAHGRWLLGATQLARRGILAALKDEREYAYMSRWIAERLIRELGPLRRSEDEAEEGTTSISVHIGSPSQS